MKKIDAIQAVIAKDARNDNQKQNLFVTSPPSPARLHDTPAAYTTGHNRYRATSQQSKAIVKSNILALIHVKSSAFWMKKEIEITAVISGPKAQEITVRKFM